MAYEMILTALADETRRNIFESLRDTPSSVSELSKTQPVSRPAVSQHLKVLQEAGLVSVKPHGTRRVYAIKQDGLDELRTWLDTFWSDALNAYGREIQRQMGDSDVRTSD